MRELDTQPKQRSQYFWQLQFLIGHERQRFSAVLKVSSAPGNSYLVQARKSHTLY